IHQLFEAQVERTPDAVALIFEDQQLTYRQLNERANQLAHYLQKKGVKPEVLVSICIERSLEMVVGLLGILKAGGAYVPLDPKYPRERLSYILQDAQVSVLLTQQLLVESLPEHSAQVVRLDADWQKIAQQSPENSTNEVRGENLAYVIYTSGSTGKPKGVAIEHRSSVALLCWAKEVFTSEQLAGVLASTSICFDLSV
ncbi:MAG: AMP-binding protein, partial [Nostoc sp.]